MSDNPLQAIQRWMQDALIFPRQTSATETQGHLLDSPRQSAAERLAIYQRSYYLRLLDCMRAQFPVLCHTLGEALFNDFSGEYLRSYPSKSYTLFDLGLRFPDWLEENRPDRDAPPKQREGWIDFMVDLAHFEKTIYTLFDAAGNEGQIYADASTNDEDLHLQPAVRFTTQRFALSPYYHAVRDAQEAPVSPPVPTHYLFVRRDYRIKVLALPPIQFAFLQHMNKGRSVDAAFSQVAQEFNTCEAELKQAWAGEKGVRRLWCEHGVFMSRRQPSEPGT